METQIIEAKATPFVPWNKGRVTGQKPPLKPREVWAIRVRLQISDRVRYLALFNLAIDSKLLGCDLVHLRVEDVMQADQVRTRALVSQRKTGRRSNLRLPSRRAPRLRIGCAVRLSNRRTGYSQAESTGASP